MTKLALKGRGRDLEFDETRVDGIAAEFGFPARFPLGDRLRDAYFWYDAYSSSPTPKTDNEQDKQHSDVAAKAQKLRQSLKRASPEVQSSLVERLGYERLGQLDSILLELAGNTRPADTKARYPAQDRAFTSLVGKLRRAYIEGTGQTDFLSNTWGSEYTGHFHRYLQACFAVLGIRKEDAALHQWLKRHPKLRDMAQKK